MVSEQYGCNTLCTTLFLKTALRIHLDAHIRTIVVLTGGKLIWIYFLYLLSTIYFSVMMHLRQGKKVTKGNKRKKPKIKVLAHELLASTLSYLMLAPW
jgi:hypothetical protein